MDASGKHKQHVLITTCTTTKPQTPPPSVVQCTSKVNFNTVSFNPNRTSKCVNFVQKHYGRRSPPRLLKPRSKQRFSFPNIHRIQTRC